MWYWIFIGLAFFAAVCVVGFVSLLLEAIRQNKYRDAVISYRKDFIGYVDSDFQNHDLSKDIQLKSAEIENILGLDNIVLEQQFFLCTCQAFQLSRY